MAVWPRLLWAALVAAVLLAGICGFGLWLRLHAGAPTAIDIWWHDVAGLSRDAPMFLVARALHYLGSTIAVASVITICASTLFLMRRWRDACTLITAGVLGVMLSETIKALVARPRPLDALVTEHSFSYPSGHSMGAAMLTVSLVLMLCMHRSLSRAATRWAWAGAVAWTLLMMWSRTAVQVHWLTDTIAGALLGVAVAILARCIFLTRPRSSRLA